MGGGLEPRGRSRVENRLRMSDATKGVAGALTGTVSARPLPAGVEARQRRDVDRLPRPRRDARALGRGEGPASRDLRPARSDRALPPRGAGRRAGLAPQRRRGDRRRRGRRAPLHRLRVLRRRDAQAAHRPAGRAAARRGGRVRDRGRPRAGRCPRSPAGPPRRQAAERAHRLRGPRQGHRLRDRSRARAGRADEDRPRARDDRLRLPRAGDGSAGRRALGHLLARGSCSTRCSPARSRSRPTTSSAWR